MQLAVTGALGLIGSSLIKILEKKAITIKYIDIRNNSDSKALNIDITNNQEVKNALSDCDGVIHLAAISRVIWGEINPKLCHDINVEGTKNIINACLSLNKKPWLIYASSREVYGQQERLPITEDATLKPMNHYARSKYFAERLIKNAQEEGLVASIVRFSSVYGGMQDHYNRVIPAFCINAINNKPLFIEGENCIFDFTYIEDVVDGINKIITFLDSTKKSLPPIHLTTCKPASLLEIAELIRKLTKSSSEIILKPPRTFDVERFYGDFSRAGNLLGWQPHYSLSQGLQKFILELTSLKDTPFPNIKRGFNESLESYTWLPSSI